MKKKHWKKAERVRGKVKGVESWEGILVVFRVNYSPPTLLLLLLLPGPRGGGGGGGGR